MDKEKISKYLQDTYHPEAIILIGSRIEGTNRPDSDWDIFLINPQTKISGHIEWNNHTLDVTSKDWPTVGEPITTPIKPIYPNEVLFDNSEGKLDTLLEVTKEAYEKGPIERYKDAVLSRYEKLNRWQHKIEKYDDTLEVQFFYAGIFYEFAMRAWLELQNKWSLAPEQALKEIDLTDKEFAQNLREFCVCSPKEKVSLVEKMMERLEEIKKESKYL